MQSISPILPANQLRPSGATSNPGASSDPTETSLNARSAKRRTGFPLGIFRNLRENIRSSRNRYFRHKFTLVVLSTLFSMVCYLINLFRRTNTLDRSPGVNNYLPIPGHQLRLQIYSFCEYYLLSDFYSPSRSFVPYSCLRIQYSFLSPRRFLLYMEPSLDGQSSFLFRFSVSNIYMYSINDHQSGIICRPSFVPVVMSPFVPRIL
jgi:hypothetical protein